MKDFDHEKGSFAIRQTRDLWQLLVLYAETRFPLGIKEDLPSFFYCRSNAYRAIEDNDLCVDLLAWAAIAFFWKPNVTLEPFLREQTLDDDDTERFGLALRTLRYLGYVDIEHIRSDELPVPSSVSAGLTPGSGTSLVLDVPTIEQYTQQLASTDLELVEKHVGSATFNDLAASVEQCNQGLLSEEPNIRYAAIAISMYNWPDEIDDAQLFDIIRSEISEKVICGAINFLVQRHSNSDNQEVGCHLANLALDAADAKVRRFAVDALYRIRGIPYHTLAFDGASALNLDSGFVGSFLE